MTIVATGQKPALPIIDARISLLPASDRFIPIILDAVEEIGSTEGLNASADAVSSLLTGRADIVFSAIEKVFTRAAAQGPHLLLTGLIAVRSDNPAAPPIDGHLAPTLPRTGPLTSAQFTLLGPSSADQSALLQDAVDVLSANGIASERKTLATRVDGPTGILLGAFSHVLAKASLNGLQTTLSFTAVANIPSEEEFA